MNQLISSETHFYLSGRLNGINAIPSRYIESMYRLRCRVFHERLSWEVQVNEGREYDEYDDPDAVYFLIIDKLEDEVIGSCRLRPTVKENMLKNTFPFLLGQHPMPEHPDIGEISRLAVEQPKGLRGGSATFTNITKELMGRTIAWGASNGISDYVWVTSLQVERMMRRVLCGLQRIGSPTTVGDVICVVNQLPVSTQSAAHCLNQMSTKFRAAA